MEGYITTARVGDTISILATALGEPSYKGKEGTVTKLDSDGTIHGTWGDIALLHGRDSYAIIERAPLTDDEMQKLSPFERMGIGVPNDIFYSDRTDTPTASSHFTRMIEGLNKVKTHGRRNN